jgi:hypothetical protein
MVDVLSSSTNSDDGGQSRFDRHVFARRRCCKERLQHRTHLANRASVSAAGLVWLTMKSGVRAPGSHQ